PGETLTGSVAGLSITTDADTVGTLEVLTMFGFPIANTRQGQITGRGAWFELGVSSGAASQTVLHWSENAVDIGVVWVETGAATDVYRPWTGLGTGQTLAGVDAKAGELGNVFQYDNATRIITFGDAVNGNIPAVGARIRVPNVLLITGTVASSPLATDPNYTQRAAFQTNGSFAIDFEVIDLSGMETTFWGCYSLRLKETAFCGSLQMVECSSTPIVHDCGTGCHNSENLIAVDLKDTAAGGDIQRSSFTCRTSRAGYIENSASTVVQDSTFYVNSPIGNSNGLQIYKSPGSLVTNCVAFGYFGMLVTTDSSNVTLADCRAGQPTNASSTCLYLGSSGSVVSNFGIPAGLTVLAPGASLIRAEDAANITIRGIGTPQQPLDCLGILYPVLFTGAGSGSIVSDVNVTNYDIRVVTAQTAGADFRIYNVRGTGTRRVQVNGQNAEIWSYRDGDDNYGLLGSIIPSMTNVFDNAYQTTFQNDTEGTLSIICTEKALNPALYEITAGTPQFNSKGVALFEQGDQIVWTWPRKILGFTGFMNVAPEMRYLNQLAGNLASEFLIEFDIDVGSGFTNTWNVATGANLSAISVSPTDGFGFKLRVTKTGAGFGATRQNVNFIAIRGATNAVAQLELYNATETVVQLLAPSLPDGTRYQFYDVTNGVELANGVASNGFGGATNFTYTGTPVQIRLRAMYKPTATTAKRFVEEFGVVTAAGLTFLPVLNDWQPHNTYGVDGSLFDQSNGGSIAWDAANNLIRFDGSAATVSGQEVVAWAAWLMTTEDGIRTFGNLVDYTGVGPLELYRIGIEPPVEIINDSANTIVIADAVLERIDAGNLIETTSGTFHAMPRHNTGLQVSAQQTDLTAVTNALADLDGDVAAVNAIVTDNQTELSDARSDIAAIGGIVSNNSIAITDLDADVAAVGANVLNNGTALTNMQGDVSALGALGNNILDIATDNKKLLRADIEFSAPLANFFEEGTTTVLMTKNMTGGSGLGLPMTGRL
ncbi:MAG: hypothetical protein ABJZ69_03800, partial [Hyphomicrobiales bacterium]